MKRNFRKAEQRFFVVQSNHYSERLREEKHMPVYAVADNIVSPLGTTSADNFERILQGHTGIASHSKPTVFRDTFFASLIVESPQPEYASSYTKFERILIQSISDALNRSTVDITRKNTGLIISTTKGNISLLENKNYAKHKLPLHYSAQMIADHFGNPNKPIVISNACISGITALTTGKRLIEAGIYNNVVVAGADTISAFIFSGFNAFQAISPQPCKPYDADRSGVTLGEAAATIILSSTGDYDIRVTGTGGSNDANHISGPSRTGKELGEAMQKAISMAGLSPADIDFISGHGTATMYNDEMESKAINLLDMQETPVNSLKGYYGHTLGAAGLLETVITLHAMRSGKIPATLGFEKLGVPVPINVSGNVIERPLNHSLKTASGFGGCNAALVLSN